MMAWTDEQRQEVVSLWQTKSASEIANLFRERGFNVTRNSIIGIANRAGCSKPKPDKKPRAPRERKPRAVQLKVIARTPFKPATVVVQTLDKSLDELGRNDCRYITGEPSNARYCGHPVHERSFCLDHFRLCYTTTEARKPNPAAFSPGFRARA